MPELNTISEFLITRHAEIRSIAQASGAIIVLFAAPFGLWLSWRRTSELARQNDLTDQAHTYQVSRDEKNRLYESYSIGMKELAHDSEFRRQGAIVMLGDVGQHLQYSKPSFSAICAIIRADSYEQKEKYKDSLPEESKFLASQSADITSAIEQIKARKLECMNYEAYKYSLNLHEAYIPFSALSGADFRHGNLEKTVLSGSNCTLCNFYSASMSEAELINTKLKKADLSTANLRGANLKGANLRKARLVNTDISSTDLRDVKISELMFIKSRTDNEKVNEHMKHVNWLLPRPVGYGELYHPIQTAKWDPDKPPIVNEELKPLVREKTEFIKKKALENES